MPIFTKENLQRLKLPLRGKVTTHFFLIFFHQCSRLIDLSYRMKICPRYLLRDY